MALLHRNLHMRTQTLVHEDHADQKRIIESRQDVSQIIDDNKRRYNDFDERTPYAGDGFHLCARVPMVLYMDLYYQGVAQDNKALGKWLDDPDNQLFKTRPGLLSRVTRRK